MRHTEFEIDEAPIRALRRCTCCVLPETMPFIQFDSGGECNYCKTYKKHELKDINVLTSWADNIRKEKRDPDSIVSFSGGRDSSYGLHYYVKELGLKPIAYNYDWGMATDLAIRNQKLMCDKLGVKLIIVKADIKKKRENIRKNVLAWLKRPDLGLIPLFMAGDKQFYYYANKVKRQYVLNELLMASNPFERTHFKTAFCGVKPAVLYKKDQGSDIEKLPVSGILRMFAYYAKQYVTNLGYINTSVFDTIGAMASHYAISHNYMRLFDYIPWDEQKIDNTLINHYNWEKASDTESTWRIGDGTAPFYNYIYYFAAGFTENDTLRSNQIREGMLKREDALELVYKDNAPRYESLKWYFDMINLDMRDVMKKVKLIKRLY
jgi:hypothetical protein